MIPGIFFKKKIISSFLSLTQTLLISYLFLLLLNTSLMHRITIILALFLITSAILLIRYSLINFYSFLILLFVSNLSLLIIPIVKLFPIIFYFKSFYLHINFILLFLVFNSITSTLYLFLVYSKIYIGVFLTNKYGLVLHLLWAFFRFFRQIGQLFSKSSMLNIFFLIFYLLFSRVFSFISCLVRIKIINLSFFQLLASILIIGFHNAVFYLIFNILNELVVYNISSIKIKDIVEKINVQDNKNTLFNVNIKYYMNKYRHMWVWNNLNSIFKTECSENLYIETTNILRFYFHQIIMNFFLFRKKERAIRKDLNEYYVYEITNLLEILKSMANAKKKYNSLLFIRIPQTNPNLSETVWKLNFINSIFCNVYYKVMIFYMSMIYEISCLNIIKILEFVTKTGVESKMVTVFKKMLNQISYTEKLCEINLQSGKIEELIIKMQKNFK